jgi:hypothetical protein
MKDTTRIKLDTLTVAFAELQAKADEATRAANDVKKVLAEALEQDQIKTHEVQDGGKIYRATFLQAIVPIIDEEGLEKELGAEVYDRYTKKVLDKKALEQAMESNEVDPLKVGKHVTERKNAASVRFTVRAADDS